MSVLLCHDHRFAASPSGQVYSPGQYDLRLIDRYARSFGDVYIAARCRYLQQSDDVSRLSLVFENSERFIPLPNLSKPWAILNARHSAAARLRQIICHVDLIIARLPSEIGLLALEVAKDLGKPTAVEVVACISDGLRSHGSRLGHIYAPLARYRMQRAVRQAGSARYVTREWLQSRYPSTNISYAISNVDIRVDKPDVLHNRIRVIRESRKPIKIGMVAALFHREKGVDVAIRALALAKKTELSLELKVLGPGDPEPWHAIAARLGLHKSVQFCGVLPRGSAVLAWLDGIDVYIQASFQEGLPRALIEAMSRATPALASAAGGTAELIQPEFLHTPGDYKTLAKQLLAVCPADVRIAMAERNFNTAKEYDSAKIDEKLRAYWDTLSPGTGT